MTAAFPRPDLQSGVLKFLPKMVSGLCGQRAQAPAAHAISREKQVPDPPGAAPSCQRSGPAVPIIHPNEGGARWN
jgi:hypothetical protein